MPKFKIGRAKVQKLVKTILGPQFWDFLVQ